MLSLCISGLRQKVRYRPTVCPRIKLSKFWRYIARKVRKTWQYSFAEQSLVVFLTCVPNISKFIYHYIKYKLLKGHIYGTIFPLSRNVVHACGFARVQSYTDQDMSSLSDPLLPHCCCCCCFVCQNCTLDDFAFFVFERTLSQPCRRLRNHAKTLQRSDNLPRHDDEVLHWNKFTFKFFVPELNR